jgi:hypothetical protein
MKDKLYQIWMVTPEGIIRAHVISDSWRHGLKRAKLVTAMEAQAFNEFKKRYWYVKKYFEPYIQCGTLPTNEVIASIVQGMVMVFNKSNRPDSQRRTMGMIIDIAEQIIDDKIEGR